MVLSALFFIDLKGKVLISRNYRGDVTRAQAERFAQKVQETDPTELKPVFVDAGVSYVYLQVIGSRATAVATRVMPTPVGCIICRPSPPRSTIMYTCWR